MFLHCLPNVNSNFYVASLTDAYLVNSHLMMPCQDHIDVHLVVLFCSMCLNNDYMQLMIVIQEFMLLSLNKIKKGNDI